MGEFFFRSYVPGAADRDRYIGRVIDEFKAAIRLNPKQIESSFRLEQIWNNMNPLGLPRNFDVIPNFKEYMANYSNVANLVTTFTSIGSTLLIKSSGGDSSVDRISVYGVMGGSGSYMPP